MGYMEDKNLGLTGYLGIWAGKILISATRLTRRGGTTFPGRVSLKIAPDILAALSQQTGSGNIIVSGTNGKTSTTALLTHMVKTAGYTAVSNQAGSNLSWGIATSLIDASSWRGRLSRRYGVLEIDEGYFPKLAGQLQPLGAVVTNIFPDQLDRFGEIDTVRQYISRGLSAMPVSAFRVLNADDPYLASLESGPGATWYYGLETLPIQEKQASANRDYICPRCQNRLNYRQVFLAHQGHYHCPHCGFERPRPQVTLLEYEENADRTAALKISIEGQSEEICCPLPGIYNVYNVLAAVTAARSLGLPVDIIKKALLSFPRTGGRLKKVALMDGRILIIGLMKNAVGAGQALAQALSGQKTAEDEKISLLIAINDRLADGRDISWLWNVEFEQLAACRGLLYPVIVAGSRAWDMAVRLKYAGLNEHQIVVEKNLEAALLAALQATPPRKNIHALTNYTAQAALNRALDRLKISRAKE